MQKEGLPEDDMNLKMYPINYSGNWLIMWVSVIFKSKNICWFSESSMIVN